jgi:hypothetical protein
MALDALACCRSVAVAHPLVSVAGSAHPHVLEGTFMQMQAGIRSQPFLQHGIKPPIVCQSVAHAAHRSDLPVSNDASEWMDSGRTFCVCGDCHGLHCSSWPPVWHPLAGLGWHPLAGTGFHNYAELPRLSHTLPCVAQVAQSVAPHMHRSITNSPKARWIMSTGVVPEPSRT